MPFTDFIAALPHRPFCFPCLVRLHAGPEPVIRGGLEALLDGPVEARVDECWACKGTTRVTFRFVASASRTMVA